MHALLVLQPATLGKQTSSAGWCLVLPELVENEPRAERCLVSKNVHL